MDSPAGLVAIDHTHRDDFGVYVHVPFCLRRCPYCNFAIAVRRDIPHEQYLEALLQELAQQATRFEGRSPATLYFGGGTPSLWSAACIARVIAEVEARWQTHLEVTLEANPEELDDATLHALKSAGVDRLSLGIQSFDADTLKLLGRHHDPVSAVRAVERARAHGFDCINIDVIFGVPGRPDASTDIETVLELGASHVSAYGLTVEPNTPFGRQKQRGTLVPLDEDGMADRYEAVVAQLAAGGLHQYEVSNYARSGAWSRHNLIYWLGGEYLGLGMGAHSMRQTPSGGAVRWARGPDLKRYLANPVGPPEMEEKLSPSVHLAERIFMHLRTRVVLDPRCFERSYGVELVQPYVEVLNTLTDLGLLDRSGAGYRTTPKGLQLHDSIATAVMAVVAES